MVMDVAQLEVDHVTRLWQGTQVDRGLPERTIRQEGIVINKRYLHSALVRTLQGFGAGLCVTSHCSVGLMEVECRPT